MSSLSTGKKGGRRCQFTFLSLLHRSEIPSSFEDKHPTCALFLAAQTDATDEASQEYKRGLPTNRQTDGPPARRPSRRLIHWPCCVRGSIQDGLVGPVRVRSKGGPFLRPLLSLTLCNGITYASLDISLRGNRKVTLSLCSTSQFQFYSGQLSTIKCNAKWREGRPTPYG